MVDSYKPFNLVFVESQPEISKMVSFALEGQFSTSVFEVADNEAAIHFLTTTSDIAVVIVGDAEKHAAVVDYILNKREGEPLRLILCVDQKLKDPSLLMKPQVLGVVRRKTLIEELTALLRDKLFKGDLVEEGQSPEFIKINPPLLVLAPPLRADLYIRLGKTKYLKIFRKDDSLTSAEIERYWKEKGIDYFYVRREETAGFTQAFNAEVEKMVHLENVETAAVRAMAVAVHDTVYETISKMGVTEEVREMTKASMKLVVKSIGTQPRLGDIFNRIQKEMGHYIVAHSLALGEIACVFAANIEWASDLTFNKLILAALFHDITLKNHELARAKVLQEAVDNPSLLLLDTMEEFKLHPLRASNLVNSLHNVPPDVDLIIRQHHEKPDGSGFPQGIAQQQFSPLSSIFIIAHDFLDCAYEAKGPFSLQDFIELRRKTYAGGYFRKIFKGLEDRLNREPRP